MRGYTHNTIEQCVYVIKIIHARVKQKLQNYETGTTMYDLSQLYPFTANCNPQHCSDALWPEQLCINIFFQLPFWYTCTYSNFEFAGLWNVICGLICHRFPSLATLTPRCSGCKLKLMQRFLQATSIGFC